MKASLTTLDLNPDVYDKLLHNPQEYLNSLSEVDATRMRAVLLTPYRQSFRIIFYVCTGLAVLGFVVAFFLMPQLELNRPDDEKLKEEGRKEQQQEK